MNHLRKFLSILILVLFSTSTAFAAVTNGVIPRSQWGANESLRYVNGDLAAGPSVGDSTTDADYSNNWDITKYSKVINSDNTGTYKWPLQYPQKVQKIIIHHTATSNTINDPAATIRSIYYYHAISRTWGDIGYNYIMDQNGNIYEGRAGGASVVGGHAGKGNNGSIGIAVLGNFSEKAVPDKVVMALAKFISKQTKLYGINPQGSSQFAGSNLPNILGHRDIMSTECPGDYLYEKLPLIRQLAAKTYDEKKKFVKDYDFQDKSDTTYFITLKPGEEQEISLRFENIGKKAWDNKTFIVVDSSPTFKDVVSFPDKKDVVLANLNESSVASGGTGTFKFKVKGGKKPSSVQMNVTILANGFNKMTDYVNIPVSVEQSAFRYKVVETKYPPEAMEPGQTFEASVKLKNTGNVTWQSAGTNVAFLAASHEQGRKSQFVSPAGQKMGVLKESTVKPGETGTFIMKLTAPMTKGLYKEYFTPLVDWETWMPDIGMNFNVLVGADPYSSEVVSQSTSRVWERGKSYNMWINIKNMGAKTWTNENIKLTFIKEEDLKVTNAKLLNPTLGPGTTGRISFTITVDKNDDLGKKTMMVRPNIDGQYITNKPISFEYTTVLPKTTSAYSSEETSTTKPTTTTPTTATIPTKDIKQGSGKENDIRIKLTFAGTPEISANGSYTIKSGSSTVATLSKSDVAKVEQNGSGYKVTVGSKSYTKTEPIRFVPDSGTILKVNNFTRTYNEFRGILEARIVDGKLVLINELGLEAYMKGLGEEPNATAMDKIKTITVAARSYAKYYMDIGVKFAGKPYHLEDDPATSQKYLGYSFEKVAPNVVKAAEDTKGQVVTYKGTLIKAAYFSRSDGTYTKSAKAVWGTDIPYLVPVKDSYCKNNAFWGHGVGLSGCGAAAMADQGFNYVQILKYYYTGTEVTDLY